MTHYPSSLNDGKHIFVFGSNVAGIHGAGAAKDAAKSWGAVRGCGRGLTGQAYAIPTKDENLKSLPIPVIRYHVRCFLRHARVSRDKVFLVTRIGCGLAGYTDEQIAPMFKGAPSNCRLPEEWASFQL